MGTIIIFFLLLKNKRISFILFVKERNFLCDKVNYTREKKGGKFNVRSFSLFATMKGR